METFFTTELTIPITQVMILLTLSTLALIFGRIRLALLINYCFTLYWGYIANLDLFRGDQAAKVAKFSLFYFGFGAVIIVLAVIGFMYYRE